MKQTQPQLLSPSALAPDNATHTTPFSQQTVVLTKQAYIELKWEAHDWRAQHGQLVAREAALKREVETLQATMRDLQQRLYGTKSEQASGADGTASPKADRPKKRGQQPGSQGHGRALSQSWLLEAKSENRLLENQSLASLNFPVFGDLRQSPCLCR